MRHHRLTIESRAARVERDFQPGASILDALIESSAVLPVHCGGSGGCGGCRIRIESAVPPPPTAAEGFHLTKDELAIGVRLACQQTCLDGLHVSLVDEPEPAAWHPIDPESFPRRRSPGAPRLPAGEGRLGVAVDFGTTHIRLSIWDLQAPRRLAALSRLNPQRRFGADILQRLLAARRSDAAASRMARLGAEAIAVAIGRVTANEAHGAGRVGRVAVVGNTAMLTLLGGRGCAPLLDPRHWEEEIDCRPRDPDALKASWGIDRQASLTVVPAVAGFVGSDLIAAIVASGMHVDHGCALLVDFGTNSEMALWDGRRFWVASAAGGPAFDGCGIGCGMPAGPGAVYRIEATGDLPAARYAVADSLPPLGICGSGLVDAIAMLRRAGRLTVTGRFTGGEAADGVPVIDGRPPIRLRMRDVDSFQRAKAAIGAGTAVLLREAGLAIGDVARIFVCGAFGRHLDIRNAQEIGLLPDISPKRFEMLENASLVGCEQLMLASNGEEIADSIRERTRPVALAASRAFEEAFADHLLLRPPRLPEG